MGKKKKKDPIASQEQVLTFLRDVKQQLLRLTNLTDSGYEKALAGGVHPALLGDLYDTTAYDGPAVADQVLAWLDHIGYARGILHRTINPWRLHRQRRTVRGLGELGVLAARHDFLYGSRISPVPAWQSRRHAQARYLRTLMCRSQWSLNPESLARQRQAEMLAYAILNFLYAFDHIAEKQDPELFEPYKYDIPTVAQLDASRVVINDFIAAISDCKPRRLSRASR